MKTRMAQGKHASDGLSKIQGSRDKLYQDHFKNYDKVWKWARTIPEVRLAAESLEEDAIHSPGKLTGKILARLDAGASDEPSRIPAKNSVTHIAKTLHEDNKQWRKLFEHYTDTPTPELDKVVSDLDNLITGEGDEFNLEKLKDLDKSLGKIREDIKEKIPAGRRSKTNKNSDNDPKPLTKIEKQTLLREIDNIRDRLTLGHEIATLSKKLGGLSISDMLGRIYQLSPYLTGLEAMGTMLGPVSEQRANLVGWQAQLSLIIQSSATPEENQEHIGSYGVQLLKGAIHDLATQQAEEQANKTAQQIVTLDAIKEALQYPEQSEQETETTDIRWKFQPYTPTNDGQKDNQENTPLNTAYARPLQELLSSTPQTFNGVDQDGNIVDRLAATVETPEGKLSAFDAAIWGYLGVCYPGELSGEAVDIDLLKGARGYEAALERMKHNKISAAGDDDKDRVDENVKAATMGDWIKWLTTEAPFIPSSTLPTISQAEANKQLFKYLIVPGTVIVGSTALASTKSYVHESFNQLGSMVASVGGAAGRVVASAAVSAVTVGVASLLGSVAFLGVRAYEDVAAKKQGRPRPDPLTIEPAVKENADGVPEEANWRVQLPIESDSTPTANVSNRLVTQLANEVLTDHHRLNHAFESYQDNAPALRQFFDALNDPALSIPQERKVPIATAAQNGRFSEAIEKLEAGIEKKDGPAFQSILKEVIHLAEHRNFRNISNFIARAERDERPLNSSEREMIKLWINQLVDLYEKESIVGGGTNETEGTDFDLLRDHLEYSDQLLSRLVQTFRTVDQATQRDNPPVDVDPNMASKRLDNWQSYFRSAIKSWAAPYEYEVEHSDRIKSGRAIVNCNHGLMTIDMGWLVDRLRVTTGKDVRMVIDRNLSRIPGVGGILHATGFHEGTPQLNQGLLASETVVCAAPGGMDEALQTAKNRNGLRSDRRLLNDGSEKGPTQGYIKDHITMAAPIYTSLTPRADDIAHAPDSGFARFAYDELRAPVGMVNMRNARPNKVISYVSKPIPAPILPVNNASITSEEMKNAVNIQHRSVTDRAAAQLLASDVTMPFRRLPSRPQKATA